MELYEFNFLNCQRTLGDGHQYTWSAWSNYRNALLLAENHAQLFDLCKAVGLPLKIPAIGGALPAIRRLALRRCLGKTNGTQRFSKPAKLLQLKKKPSPTTKVTGGRTASWDRPTPNRISGKKQISISSGQCWPCQVIERYISRLNGAVRTEFIRILSTYIAIGGGSQEREKWQAELAKFEEERALLDPLALSKQQE